MKLPDVQEVFEARSVINCNEALRQGWHLLAIHESRRGPVYILGARTHTDAASALELPAAPPLR